MSTEYFVHTYSTEYCTPVLRIKYVLPLPVVRSTAPQELNLHHSLDNSFNNRANRTSRPHLSDKRAKCDMFFSLDLKRETKQNLSALPFDRVMIHVNSLDPPVESGDEQKMCEGMEHYLPLWNVPRRKRSTNRSLYPEALLMAI